MDILTTLGTYILPFLVILTVVVFVHELGHFLVARWNGVRVEVFSIGFGRELAGFTDRHGTRWKFSLIPLGGYVKFFGDADAASTTKAEGVDGLSDELKKVAFPHKSVGQRAAIVAAGPLFNFLFAIVVFAGVFMTVGQPVTQPVVGEVRAGSAAEAAGLLPGDRFVAIQGSRVERFEDVQRLVQLYGTAPPMRVEVERDGQRLTFNTSPTLMESQDSFGNPIMSPILGVAVSREQTDVVRYGPTGALWMGVRNTWDVTSMTLVAFGQMITGKRGTDDLGGPIRIAEYSGQAAQTGVVGFILFIAILSVNLGLINLFPIPILDGGHLVFYAAEAILGKPLGEKAQEVGLRLGLGLILALMVFVTWNDIVRWFSA